MRNYAYKYKIEHINRRVMHIYAYKYKIDHINRPVTSQK